MLELTFWSSLIFVFYAYLGYPLFLWLISLFRRKSVMKRDITPKVSFIITAYNEEKRIREKIENTLRQDFPRKSLEIIVTSDCSNDQTDNIVRLYESNRVRLVRASERRGKEAAQKLAVDSAHGEILVFSDVATILPPDGITNIVKNFHDPTVGCISSVDRIIDSDGKISGERAYVKYEMFLRSLESKVGSLVGLSGSFFAARKEVCQNWAVDRQSDFHALLNAMKIGLRSVSDPDSIAYYKNITDESKEFERKVRTILRGIFVFMENLHMLNPFRYGIFSWQLFSHKLCRWLVPFALGVTLLSNALLVYSSNAYLYYYVFFIQCSFYTISLSALYIKTLRAYFIIRIPFYFLIANLSILNAWFCYAQGQRIVSWIPSER